MTKRIGGILNGLGTFVLIWLAVGLAGMVAGNIALWAMTGYRSSLPVTYAPKFTWYMITHIWDPAYAYGPYADDLRLVVYLAVFFTICLVIYMVIVRQGILERRKDPLSLPLAKRIRPSPALLGIWTPPKTSTFHPIHKFMLRFGPKYPDGLELYRPNGMMAKAGGEQPGPRILLGKTEQVHFFRKQKYYVYARGDHHVIVFGPSGGGKGVSQMNPSLLFWNGDEEGSVDGRGKGWPGPLITSTVKNDHVDVSLEWRTSLSDQCIVYDPLQLYPEFSQYWAGWNPLDGISNASDANSVAQALMESESQQSVSKSGTDEYFTAQAMMVLGPLLLSGAIGKLPFRTVYEWALALEGEATSEGVVSETGEVDPDSTMYAVLSNLYDYADETGDKVPINQMEQVFGKDPREASGVWGTVRKTLLPYNDEVSVRSTSPDFMPRMLDPKKFYNTPYATLYIIAPEVANEAKRMRPVFAAFISWLIEQAQIISREHNGKLPMPVLANLDEVKNVGAIPGLAHTLSLTRSAGFFVKHAWQDEAQIESAYGKDDSKTITSNSRTWVVLPGISDPNHLETLAKLIGEQRVRKVSKSRKWGKPISDSSSLSREQVRMADVSAIKQLKDDELLIVADNMSPFIIKQARHYQDKTMLARFEMGDERRAARKHD